VFFKRTVLAALPTYAQGRQRQIFWIRCTFERAKETRYAQKDFTMITRNLGMLALAIYLILVGIISLIHVAIPAVVIGILALIAGILILIGR
jgi:hypothetical protein